MESAPLIPTETIELAGTAAQDLSILGLFMSADIVIKIVMIGLLALSVWSWALIFSKSALIRKLNRRADKFEQAFWSGNSLDDLYDRLSRRPRDPMSVVFVAGMREWRMAMEKATPAERLAPGLQDRTDRVMQAAIQREMGPAENGMVVLASVGSACPFIGLFGTVWGIINSFTAIAASQNTTLAVVAPGIAEALFTTALGLVAAIPATIAFNTFSRDLTRYADRLDGFAAEFSALLSRHAESGRAA